MELIKHSFSLAMTSSLTRHGLCLNIQAAAYLFKLAITSASYESRVGRLKVIPNSFCFLPSTRKWTFICLFGSFTYFWLALRTIPYHCIGWQSSSNQGAQWQWRVAVQSLVFHKTPKLHSHRSCTETWHCWIFSPLDSQLQLWWPNFYLLLVGACSGDPVWVHLSC